VKPTISVVINTLNEEKNLPFALRSVQSWADEIVVVDMHSDDQTAQIARDAGARVFFHDRIVAFDEARIFAVGQATGDWILLLDADEVIARPLSLKLMQIASLDEADVVVIPWLNYLLGAPLLHTGWGPHQDRHPRFFRKDRIDLNPRIHSFIHPATGARVLNLPPQDEFTVHHFSYLDIAHFLEKLNRYTSVEAQQAFERGETSGKTSAAIRAVVEFVYRYIFKQGFMDGWRGFYLSGFMATYRLAISAKLQELHAASDRNSNLEAYHRSAEELIAAYEPRSALREQYCQSGSNDAETHSSEDRRPLLSTRTRKGVDGNDL
jgi:glycosyltransferase involved in cell wall biosynthesis